jgi:hypothetical protein
LEGFLEKGDGPESGFVRHGAFQWRFAPVGLPIGVLEAVQPVSVRLRHAVVFGHGM